MKSICHLVLVDATAVLTRAAIMAEEVHLCLWMAGAQCPESSVLLEWCPQLFFRV